MNQPTTITETEGEWARDAAYALEHLSDPATYPIEFAEGEGGALILCNAETRRATERAMRDFDRLIQLLRGVDPELA